MSKLITRRRIASRGVVPALASTGVAVAYGKGGGTGTGSADALPVDGSLVFADSGLNQDECKGATLTLALSSS